MKSLKRMYISGKRCLREWTDVVAKLNQVDWSMDNAVRFNILVIPAKKKNVITGKESIRAAGMVISYMVMGRSMTSAEVKEVREIIKKFTNCQSDKLPDMMGVNMDKLIDVKNAKQEKAFELHMVIQKRYI